MDLLHCNEPFATTSSHGADEGCVGKAMPHSPLHPPVGLHDPPSIPPYEQFQLPNFALPGAPQPVEDSVALPDFSPNLSTLQLRSFRKPALDIVYLSTKLAQARGETLLLRNNAGYWKNNNAFKGDYLLASSQELLDAVSQQEPALFQADQLDTYKQRLSSDHEAFKTAVAEYREYQDQLSKKESSMSRREAALAKVAKELTDLIQELILSNSLDLGSYTPPGTVTEPTTRPPSLSQPSYLANYYDTIGTMRYLQERLDHIESDHREELAQRELLEDQERPSDISKELFEAGYRIARDKALRDLGDARQALHMAREACAAEGVDVPDIDADAPFEGIAAEEASSLPSERLTGGILNHPKSATTQSSLSGNQDSILKTPPEQRDDSASPRRPRRRKRQNSTKVHKWIEVVNLEAVKPDDLYTEEELMRQLDTPIPLPLHRGGVRKGRSLEGLNTSYVSAPVLEARTLDNVGNSLGFLEHVQDTTSKSLSSTPMHRSHVGDLSLR